MLDNCVPTHVGSTDKPISPSCLSDMTSSAVLGQDGLPMTDSLGQTLQLSCVWPAVGSRLPE
jgi:hypothetical protein